MKLTPAQLAALRHLADAPASACNLHCGMNTLWALSARKLAHPELGPGLTFSPTTHRFVITRAGRAALAGTP